MLKANSGFSVNPRTITNVIEANLLLCIVLPCYLCNKFHINCFILHSNAILVFIGKSFESVMHTYYFVFFYPDTPYP